MENIVKEFETPQIYPHPVKYIKKIETHCSWVFLTGEYAYKIKKPVNYGFLDFSTADKRKYYTVREYELNRELSPEIYLGVVKIGFKDGKLNLQGEGDILEYALKMKEMPQESIMRNLLQKDMVSLKEVHRLIEKIASFHEKAETSGEIKKEGSLATVKFNWRENFDQTEGFIDVTIDGTTYHKVKQIIENFMESQQELFIKREEEGKIRFCHGDLHSGNIFIYEGIPYIFDRIEFNLRFACSDTAATDNLHKLKAPNTVYKAMAHFLHLSQNYKLTNGFKIASHQTTEIHTRCDSASVFVGAVPMNYVITG